MKKSLVVLLVLGAVLSGQVASATAVDWNTVTYTSLAAGTQSIAAYITLTTSSDTDKNGGWTPPSTAIANGMLDRAELATLQAVLLNPASPNHLAVHTAWDTNILIATAWAGNSVNPVVLGSTQHYGPILAAHMTIGGPEEVAFLTGFTSPFTGFLGALPLTFDTSCSTILASYGDADNDGYTNLAEYNAALTGVDLVGPWTPPDSLDAQRALLTTNYVAGATTPNTTTLTCTITKTPAQATQFEGATIVLTATSTSGTGTVNYSWFRGVTSIGSGATLTITGATAADSGSYTAVATDSSSPLPQQDTSNAIQVTVLAATGLPVMGMVGIALLVGLAGALGVRKIRK